MYALFGHVTHVHVVRFWDVIMTVECILTFASDFFQIFVVVPNNQLFQMWYGTRLKVITRQRSIKNLCNDTHQGRHTQGD